MIIMMIGVIAKVAKNAVAPANLKGSFFFNSEKDFRIKLTTDEIRLVAFLVIDADDIKERK